MLVTIATPGRVHSFHSRLIGSRAEVECILDAARTAIIEGNRQLAAVVLHEIFTPTEVISWLARLEQLKDAAAVSVT